MLKKFLLKTENILFSRGGEGVKKYWILVIILNIKASIDETSKFRLILNFIMFKNLLIIFFFWIFNLIWFTKNELIISQYVRIRLDFNFFIFILDRSSEASWLQKTESRKEGWIIQAKVVTTFTLFFFRWIKRGRSKINALLYRPPHMND